MTGLDIDIDFALYGSSVNQLLNLPVPLKKLHTQEFQGTSSRQANSKSVQNNKTFKVFSEHLNYKEKAKAKVKCY